ncbi:pyroglutamyl-peptidase I [Demequina sp.]|uniref:pyroglutamyl-peptidase I n=1 Tax=Demequina sp. TaxID=2050685 RepID=UPI003D0B6AEF
MARVLLTGFEPFAEATINPSWDAVEMLADAWSRDDELVIRRLPVVFGSGGRRLVEHVAAHTPDVVVAVGVAEGRSSVTPERLAINLRDARIPDNAGRQPVDVPCVGGGPAAYFSTLPVTAIVDAIAGAGISAEASLTAGAYVCNDAFYALQHSLVGLGVSSGFIHVPATPQMGLGEDVPTMPLGRIAKALEIAITVALEAKQ